VRVALHPEVAVSVSVNVAQSPEEAEMQAKGVDPLRREFELAAAEDAAAAEENKGKGESEA
jgi:large subunit ribosomal protein L9